MDKSFTARRPDTLVDLDPIEALASVQDDLLKLGLKAMLGLALLLASVILLAQPANLLFALSFPTFWLLLLLIAYVKPTTQRLTGAILVAITALVFPALVYINGLAPASLIPVGLFIPLLLARGWLRIFSIFTLVSGGAFVPFSSVPYDAVVWTRLMVTSVVLGAALLAFFTYLEKLIATSRLQVTQLNSALNEAKVANQVKSQFLASISHEIRTPMHSVLGVAQFLARPGRYAEDVATQANKIVRAGQSLQQILNDVLDFSKIESGKLTLNPHPFSLTEVLENLSVLMNNAAKDKQLELAIDCPIPVNKIFVADGLRLEQVLINLLSNAIKFTKHGVVSLQIHIIHEESSAAVLRFRVIDTGIGMSAEQIGLICQPFQQADNTIASRFGGTGLGLAICTELLRLMNTQLEISSTPGEGSIFSFDLTLDSPDSLSAPPEPDSKIRVLAADDQSTTRDALASAISSVGWEATILSNGQDLLRAYKASIESGEPAEMLLLDWQMPDLDGLQLAREIRLTSQQMGIKEPPTVVMVTGFNRDELLHSPNANFADFVISKPATGTGLRDAYRTLFNQKRGRKAETDAGDLLGVQILAVDDNAFNRDVARMIFEGEGATVHLAESAQTALAWLRSEDIQVDAVLMDVQMPNMNGLEATRILRREPRFSTLPIIGMSGAGYESDYKAAHDAGMDAYLTKPIDVEHAIKTLTALLEKQTPTFLDSTQTKTSATKPTRRFDQTAALGFWKTEETLISYLERFKAEFGERLEDAADADSNFEPAELHKIKGAASTLYLYDLCNALNEVEDALKNGLDVHRELGLVYLSWQQSVAEIDVFIAMHKTLHSGDGKAQVVTLPSDVPTDSLKRLLAAVGTHQLNEVTEVLSPLILAFNSTPLRAVQEAVEGLDFDKAESVLKAVLTEQETREMQLILVVDDDEFMLSAMQQQLRGRYRVALCLFAEQAPKLIERLSPDLIVTDQYMPGFSGIELTAWVKSQKAYQHIPVILQSANDMTTQPLDTPEHLEPDMILDKSATQTELYAAIESLLKKRAGAD